MSYKCIACEISKPKAEYDLSDLGNRRTKCRACHKLPKVKSVKKVLNKDEIKCINESMFKCKRCFISKLGTEYYIKPNGERYKGCKRCIEIERKDRMTPQKKKEMHRDHLLNGGLYGEIRINKLTVDWIGEKRGVYGFCFNQKKGDFERAMNDALKYQKEMTAQELDLLLDELESDIESESDEQALTPMPAQFKKKADEIRIRRIEKAKEKLKRIESEKEKIKNKDEKNKLYGKIAIVEDENCVRFSASVKGKRTDKSWSYINCSDETAMKKAKAFQIKFSNEVKSKK